LRTLNQSFYTALVKYKMAYKISFRNGAEEAFESLNAEAASKVEKKLERVANDEWRTPYDWGYSTWSGQADGKFNWGSYRVFADIDTANDQIIVHEARHRENLYR
jgi:mRNA-degrading endonuclease RelE of RelBE toxin-antitoxin system